MRSFNLLLFSTSNLQHNILSVYLTCVYIYVLAQTSQDKSAVAIQRRLISILRKRQHLVDMVDVCLAETVEEMVRFVSIFMIVDAQCAVRLLHYGDTCICRLSLTFFTNKISVD